MKPAFAELPARLRNPHSLYAPKIDRPLRQPGGGRFCYLATGGHMDHGSLCQIKAGGVCAVLYNDADLKP